MRLDHLLSREKAEAEMRKLIPRSMQAEEIERDQKLVKGSCPKDSKKAQRASQTPESGLTRTHSVKRKLLNARARIEICIVFRVRQENSGASESKRSKAQVGNLTVP